MVIIKVAEKISSKILDKNFENYLISEIYKKYLDNCFDYGYIKKINNIVIDKDAEIVSNDVFSEYNFLITLDCDIIDFNINDQLKCLVTRIDKQLDLVISENIIYNNEKNLPFLVFVINTKTKKIKLNDTLNVIVKAKKYDKDINKIHLITEIVK